MKKIITYTMAFVLSMTFSNITSYAASPAATYSFDGELGDSTPVERVEYYRNDGIVESSGDSFSFSEGKSGKCLYLNGYEALKLNLTMSSESYTISYWIKPDKITNYTPTLMITPMGFEADVFINVTLAVDNISPNIWTHMTSPYDDRYSTGIPGLLSTNEWTYITIVVDEDMSSDLLSKYDVELDEFNSGAALYINGYLVDVGKAPKGICTDTTEFWFGINIWDDLYSGYLDELAIFNTALTDNEVSDLYLSAGGDPDAEKPSDTGSSPGSGNLPGFGNSSDNGFGARPNNGSFSDDYTGSSQGSMSGNSSHLNLDNASPITTQGFETTTNAYAHIAAIIAFGLMILAAGFVLQHLKLKRNSYH